jgi:general secretion pathway protein D
MLAAHRNDDKRAARRLAWLLVLAIALTAAPPFAPAAAQDGAEKARAAAKERQAARKARAEARAQAKRAAREAKAAAAAAQGPAAPGAAPGQPTPAAPGGPAAPVTQPNASQVPELKPFETGIDYEPTSPRSLVTFNLEDATLTDLVRLISQLTGKRFILPGTTRAIKATVYAPTKVTAAEAYQAFLSILELNGMAIVPAGRYLKIVESGRVEGRPIPLYTGDETVPTGDRFVTRLQRVNNISAEDAATLLERFKSGDGSITAYAPTNTMIITDTGTNIHRMLRILDTIDVAHTGEQIWVEPVHHANATEVATRLQEIFEPTATTTSAAAKPAKAAAKKGAAPAPAQTGSEIVGARAGESRLTKILADERTNSLIILATERMYLRILEMLKYLDISMEGEGKIHVHHLQHTDAEEIASTLQSLVGGRGAAPAAGGKGATPAAGGGGAVAIFEGNVAITAHKPSNALVITSSVHDYAALLHVIDTLDTERRQVFIEAVIMELSVDRSNTFGVSFHGGIPNVPTDDSVSVLGFRAANTIGGLQGMAANGEVLSGLAVGVQGPVISNSQQLVGLSLPGFGVAINAMAASGDANILSTPHLIASDNIEAEISVGQNVPLQTSGLGGGLGGLGGLAGLGGLGGQQAAGGANPLAALGALGGLGGLGGFGGAVPRQDVGTTITITPHINDSHEIRLEIAEEISSAGAPSEAGDLGVVSIDRTRAKTELVVRDQQTVVIGGLMRDQITRADSKVPVLGDIPLIGALFRSSSKHKIKKNLILFLTPYIIRSPADLRSIYERKMRERQEFLDRYFVFAGPEYEPAMDYSRTRGLVAEIVLELKALEEQRKLYEEAALRPELSHEARPAVGQAPEGALGPVEGDVTVEPDGSGTAVEGAPVEGQQGTMPAPEATPPPIEAPEPPQPEPAPEGVQVE